MPLTKVLEMATSATGTVSTSNRPIKPATSHPHNRPPELSKPGTDLPKLNTDIIHNSRHVERLRSNPYLGDCWPTKSSPGHPCHCLSVAAHSISDAAIHAATFHYANLAFTYAASSGTRHPLLDPWKNDLIIHRVSKAQEQAVQKIRASTGLIMHSNDDHGKRLRHQVTATDYSGHVQPWMDALIHRAMIKAANEAFKEIDDRDGTKTYEDGKQRFAFSFRRPGTVLSNPYMARFPCLCKDFIANKIADTVFNNSVKLVKNFAEESPASQQDIKTRLNTSIAKATVNALEEIADPEDKKHMCSASGPALHMEPWMKMKVHSRCEEEASKCLQIIEWDRARTRTRKKRPAGEAGSEVMLSPSKRLITSTNLALNASSGSGPAALIARDEQDRGKLKYAIQVSNQAIDLLFVRLKDLIPDKDRESVGPGVRSKLVTPILKAKHKALEIIARYEAIVYEVGDIDSARHLYPQQHGWMDAFLTHAIHKAADRAWKTFTTGLETEEVCGKQAVNPRTSVEWTAVEALMRLPGEPGPNCSDSRDGRSGEMGAG